MDTAPSLVGLITGGLTMAGILVMLGRVLARFDDLARRFDELLDPKSGIVPELRKRTHELASRDQSTDASVAFLRQELEHHKRDTAVLDLSVPFDDAGPALSVDARLAILRGRWRGPLVLWSGRDDTAEVAARWGAAAVQKPADFRALAAVLRAVARPPPT